MFLDKNVCTSCILTSSCYVLTFFYYCSLWVSILYKKRALTQYCCKLTHYKILLLYAAKEQITYICMYMYICYNHLCLHNNNTSVKITVGQFHFFIAMAFNSFQLARSCILRIQIQVLNTLMCRTLRINQLEFIQLE